MFEEAQLYSPVSRHDGGTVEVHLGANHPGFSDPRLPGPPQRHRRSGRGLEAKASRYRGSTTPTARPPSGSRSAGRAGRQAPSPRTPGVPGRQGAARPARRPDPAATRSPRKPDSDRVQLCRRPRPGQAARVLLLPRRPALPLHPVRPSSPLEPLYTPEPDVIHEVLGPGNRLVSPRFAAPHPRRPAPRSADRERRDGPGRSPTSSRSRSSRRHLRPPRAQASGAGSAPARRDGSVRPSEIRRST